MLGGFVLVLVLVLALASPALAAAPQASLPDLEDEVMCPICGTLLALAEAPQAERQRAFIERQIAAGRSKGEIVDALVAEYGDEVRALPRGSGFDLTAYLVPAIAFVLAAIALAIGAGRWRRAGRAAQPGPGAGDGPGTEDAERLERDLARYDL